MTKRNTYFGGNTIVRVDRYGGYVPSVTKASGENLEEGERNRQRADRDRRQKVIDRIDGMYLEQERRLQRRRAESQAHRLRRK